MAVQTLLPNREIAQFGCDPDVSGLPHNNRDSLSENACTAKMELKAD